MSYYNEPSSAPGQYLNGKLHLGYTRRVDGNRKPWVFRGVQCAENLKFIKDYYELASVITLRIRAYVKKISFRG